MKKIIYTLILTLLFTACSRLTVNTDYDDSFDFSSQESFAIVTQKIDGADTLYIDRVVNALEQDLQSKHYKKMSKESADLIFVFHTNIESKSDIRTDYQRVGFGMYRYGGTMIATTSTYKYNEGTLIIDALSPKTKNIVWRGIGQTEVRKKKTPEDRREYINSIVSQIMAKFPHNQ